MKFSTAWYFRYRESKESKRNSLKFLLRNLEKREFFPQFCGVVLRAWKYRKIQNKKKKENTVTQSLNVLRSETLPVKDRLFEHGDSINPIDNEKFSFCQYNTIQSGTCNSLIESGNESSHSNTFCSLLKFFVIKINQVMSCFLWK